MKRLFSFIFVICILLSSASIVSAAENDYYVKGDIIVLNNLVLFDDYLIITTNDSDQSTTQNSVSPYAEVERFTQKTFNNIISDRNGAFIANFDVTVKGHYFYPSQEAEITLVIGFFSNQEVSGLTHTVFYNGDTATIYIKLNGVAIGTLSYRISPEGTIYRI